jgi:HTH-type transcriptional regulator, sugar sensing transcriptional regulator
MLQQLLQQFDLSAKESEVYLALLRYGTQSTSAIAKRLDMNRGTVFLALKELIKRGLATRTTKNGIAHHSAVSPKYLNSLLERKREGLYQLETDLKSSIPLLESLRHPDSPRPKIQFFEGREGLLTLLEDTLTASDGKLCGILSMADLYDVYGEKYFENYVKRRIEKGLSLRVMRNKLKDTKERWLTSRADHRELRYLPKNMIFPSTMYLYDGKVAFISSETALFGVLIESQEIYQIQMQLFETLWCHQG